MQRVVATRFTIVITADPAIIDVASNSTELVGIGVPRRLNIYYENE